MGTEFDVANVVDLEKLVPDCGYKLRSVNFEAVGTVASIDCDDCPDGQATVLNVIGGGTQLELADVDEIPTGEVRLVGQVDPPFEGHLRVQVEELGPR